MVRDDRVKSYTFQSSGATLYSTAGGLMAFTTAHPINGKIVKISVGNGTQENGSLFFTVSGTGEGVFTRTAVSGTANVPWYPRVAVSATNGSVLTGASGTYWDWLTVNDPIVMVGSGLGNAKTLTNVRIDYI
jgi:hypothetical protein